MLDQNNQQGSLWEEISNDLYMTGVKDAVLGAVDELCIGDLSPGQAADRMIELADGSTLGVPFHDHCACQAVHFRP